jgi:hypothetical protein
MHHGGAAKRRSSAMCGSASAISRIDVAFQQPRSVPAGDEVEAVGGEDRGERGGGAGKLVAELDAGEAGKLRLARQVSSGVSAPSSGMSSFVQVSGLIPDRTAIVISSLRLALAVRLVVARRPSAPRRGGGG